MSVHPKEGLVESLGDLVINQHEHLVLQTATGELSTTLGSVHLKLKLASSPPDHLLPLQASQSAALPNWMKGTGLPDRTAGN